MKTNFYAVSANGHVYGVYKAYSEQNAKDRCCADAGYLDEADMALRLGAPSELVAEICDDHGPRWGTMDYYGNEVR